MHLSAIELQLYHQLANAIYKDRVQLGNLMLAFFSPLRGRDYARGLMVVGRAVNDWEINFRPSELSNPQVLIDRLSHVADPSARCPMLWVTDLEGNTKGYNTRRSAFWRVVRCLCSNLDIADTSKPNWPSHIVWSNLFKVSPAAGGNPNAALRKVQRSICTALLSKEIEIYQPKHLIFLTGIHWAQPFFDSTEFTFSKVGSHHRLTFGLLSSIPTVIADHPQGKKEAELVDQILKCFSSMRD